MADPELVLARWLADTGQLREAAEVCRTHLRDHGPSADACFLLGLVAEIQGLASALEHYRRALYLDPNHYGALVQMSLLCAKRGDAARARVFTRRAERLQPPA